VQFEELKRREFIFLLGGTAAWTVAAWATAIRLLEPHSASTTPMDWAPTFDVAHRPHPIYLADIDQMKGDLEWPGLRRLLSRSASALRSTVIYRPSS